MVESENQGQIDDPALVGWFNRTGFRTVLFQRPMCAMTMIIGQVVRQNAAQMFRG